MGWSYNKYKERPIKSQIARTSEQEETVEMQETEKSLQEQALKESEYTYDQKFKQLFRLNQF